MPQSIYTNRANSHVTLYTVRTLVHNTKSFIKWLIRLLNRKLCCEKVYAKLTFAAEGEEDLVLIAGADNLFTAPKVATVKVV